MFETNSNEISLQSEKVLSPTVHISQSCSVAFDSHCSSNFDIAVLPVNCVGFPVVLACNTLPGYEVVCELYEAEDPEVAD